MSVASRVADRMSQYEQSSALFLILDNLVWPLLIVVFLGFSLTLPNTFLTSRNIEFLLYSSAALGMITLAESVCLLSGHFDLSVGAIAGFTAMVTANVLVNWFPGTPGLVGIVVILALGGFIGLMNGFSVAHLGVNPFLQTLAFLIIFEGGVLVVSPYPVSGLPDSYTYLGNASIAGVPVAVLVLLGVFALFGFLMKYTRFGLMVYSVGGNEEASAEAGIDTKRVIVTVYIISGVLAALGGLLYTGFLQSATPALADNDLFPAFAAAVIGGISLFGGRGNLVGALAGVLLLGTIEAGLVMLTVDPNLIRTINGGVLLAAVLLYTYVESRREQLVSG
jgi:ribose/xylose/arabinose/galactoside ABC-type transport system permease subunit